MKKFMTVSAIAVISCFASQANAANAQKETISPYVSAKISGGAASITNHKGDAYTSGVHVAHTDFKNKNSGFIGGKFAAGIGIPSKIGIFRFEGEYGIKGGNEWSELEAGIYKANTDIGTTHTFFANAYYDMRATKNLRPYLGAGLGFTSYEFKFVYPDINYTMSSTMMNFAWNVGAGIAYEITNNIIIDLSYRFTDYGTAKVDDFLAPDILKMKAKMHSHEALLGMRYRF
ncbi:MAG: outer membrane beta-barrel protein [Alphaproteobacteria bacterium]|nr:outer membrane beta-barrel protein [Alphaproteobacteria bacterium]MCL2505582.1 outer membrane beta-barrel protein [Alphaproteobacteria bacterium]